MEASVKPFSIVWLGEKLFKLVLGGMGVSDSTCYRYPLIALAGI